MAVVEPSHIPGLDLSTVRTQLPPQMPTTLRDLPPSQYGQVQQQGTYSYGPPQGHYSQAQQYVNEPYTENRVLTPSRYRHPSKPRSDPGSPHREFGTQTGNLNGSASELDGVYSTSAPLLISLSSFLVRNRMNFKQHFI